MYSDQLAGCIVNADHCIMCAAVMFCVCNCVTDLQIPQPAKRQCIRDEVKTAFVFARAYFVNVDGMRNALAND